MARILNALAQLVITAVVAVAVLETGCALYYYSENPWTRPAYFGGPPLRTSRYLDSFEFDPISLYTQADQPLNEDLWARDNPRLPPREPHEYRVFLVGGSTVANIRMPPGERITDFIQSGLRSTSGRLARVFNFGVPSYMSYQEMSLVVGSLIHERPDMIIVYNGVNDVFYGSVMRNWQPNVTDVVQHYERRFYEDIERRLTPLQRLNYLLEGVSYTRYVAGELALRSRTAEIVDMRRYTARQWADRLAAKRDQTCADPIPPISENPTFSRTAVLNAPAINVYIQNIRTMAEVSAQAGVAFVHILQPTAFTKKKLYPCERYSVDYNNALYRGMQSVWLASYKIVREKLTELSVLKRPATLQIDLSTLTDDMDLYLYDDFCHEWRHGPLTRIVGEEIARRVAPLIVAKR